ncbi:hypothetical protein EVAR_54944_1 [Eumeta japonica]|uniref:Uncharacterized protein n=1 Tax=Eumeta variegata TaxID=151549 RepID=A0A4C1YJ83_EUMVA|nr:hypothetical protein EVAR_54944_1 [Eumeta japonica]
MSKYNEETRHILKVYYKKKEKLRHNPRKGKSHRNWRAKISVPGIWSPRLDCGDEVRRPSRLAPRRGKARASTIRFGTLNVCEASGALAATDLVDKPPPFLKLNRPIRLSGSDDEARSLALEFRNGTTYPRRVGAC